MGRFLGGCARAFKGDLLRPNRVRVNSGATSRQTTRAPGTRPWPRLDARDKPASGAEGNGAGATNGKTRRSARRERKPAEAVVSVANGAGERAKEEAGAKARTALAVVSRRWRARRNCDQELPRVPRRRAVLFAFALLLRLLQAPLSKHFGALADPMDKVLSLLDVKPMFALQALTLLLRTADVLKNDRKGNELTLDALDAFYAVAFSILGFMVGASLMYAVSFGDLHFIIVSVFFTIMYFILYVGLDLLELKLAPFLVHHSTGLFLRAFTSSRRHRYCSSARRADPAVARADCCSGEAPRHRRSTDRD